MVEQDTIKLLRECDAGIKMGISSINDLLDDVKDANFKDLLVDSRNEHETLCEEVKHKLDEFGDDGKEPNIMAKSMSWIKTNVMIAADKSDKTVADLITDGCNMGVKSLGRYLNQYKAADEQSKDIAKRLINIEERLACDIRIYL